jgi:DNA-binding LacI/PurR family transcriptional regulator
MTLEQVAKRAKVSTATVSRVLNNLEVVRDSTRRRVLQAVEELNYHPNLHARSLAGGKSNSLGVIVSNISNPFFADVFRGMDSAANQAGYDLLVEHTDYRLSQLTASVESMIGKRVAGLAVVVSEMDQQVLDQITASELPVVFYDVGAPSPRATNIRVRYELGMHRVVQYLHSLGHRRMAFVGHHTALSPLQVRKHAFLESVKQYGSDVECQTALGTDGPMGGMQATRELLDSGFQPTAIVCVNDYMAIGVLRELRARGLSVPGDVSVTGFDNIELSEFTNPALTTLNIPRSAIGKMAFESLVRPEGFAAPPSEVLIDPELVLRDSTGAAPKR